MKFLIIRFSSIGDMVLTTPVVRCLKKQLPGSEVHFLTRSDHRDIFSANPYIDHLYAVSQSLSEVLPQLRREQYDHVIDLHHNLRSLGIKWALRRPARSFYKLNVEKWLRTALKIDRLPATHIVDRYMDTLRPFGVQNDGAGLDHFIPETAMLKESDIPAAHWAGYVALVIGAAHGTKRLPEHKLSELCLSIPYPIILLGGPNEKMVGDRISSIDPVRIYNACGKFSLHESADLVRRSRLVVSHDTGLMHIAAAFKKPIISIWGNTIPQFGMYPYYGDNYVQQQKDAYTFSSEVDGLRCRPCSKIGYRTCPRGHFHCMEKQNIALITEKVRALFR
jgi:ADP-heptose:LPS heptosyltransferase